MICNSKSLDTKIEYYLINVMNKEDFKACGLTDMDSIKFQDLKTQLDTVNNYYKLGSSIFSGNNSSSYHRIFKHNIFGYFELSAEYKKDLEKLNSKLIKAKFSTSKDSSALEKEGQKIIYPKGTYFASCLDIDSDIRLLVLVSPTCKNENKNSKIKHASLQNWIKEITIKHQIDSLQTRHIPSDPAVMAYCSSSNIKKESATIKNATMLINEGDSYLIIRAEKIKQKANKPLTWIRGWDECEILISNGKIERYPFADSKLTKLESWDKQGEIIETKDLKGAKIVININ